MITYSCDICKEYKSQDQVQRIQTETIGIPAINIEAIVLDICIECTDFLNKAIYSSKKVRIQYADNEKWINNI